MSEVELITPTGQLTVLQAATVHRLQSRVQGEVLRPGDEGYEEARKVWDGGRR